MGIRQIDITNEETAREVLGIQLPSYKIEAALIEFYGIPPLKDTVETLMECGETFLGYYEDGNLCGAVSFKTENEVIDIHRLMVNPEHFRKGIARRLLQEVEKAAESATAMIVSTGSKNKPAIQLYEKIGFHKVKEEQLPEGLSITHFKKRKENQDGSMGNQALGR